MSGYVLSRAAEKDLDEIWEYIAVDSLEAADRLIGKLFEAFEKLARNPGLGHTRKDLTRLPVLFWPLGRYLVIYRGARRPLEIVGIAHGGRHIPAFLHSRDFE
ncbi:MAG TPA: type II toxin-antitoxin system RelE/ParE family toxin [Candidatus Acidoferrales bacterium]|nr:type II toxin-antitoxin system RelE/ParE family toxin [Candidatus Acidoferrales bacterium]